jgi:hypothetical protein
MKVKTSVKAGEVPSDPPPIGGGGTGSGASNPSDPPVGSGGGG